MAVLGKITKSVVIPAAIGVQNRAQRDLEKQVQRDAEKAAEAQRKREEAEKRMKMWQEGAKERENDSDQ